VETLQVGAALTAAQPLPSLLEAAAPGAAPTSARAGDKERERAAERDAVGTFQVAFHTAKELAALTAAAAGQGAQAATSSSGDKRSAGGAAAASSSSASSAAAAGLSGGSESSSVLSLFSVDVSSGSLRLGARDSLRFLFDWTRYAALKAADAERRVLAVGQWIEAHARITLKGTAATAQQQPQQQIVDVKLRVYVD